jgi:hypothetical protein
MKSHNIKQRLPAKLPSREELILAEREIINELRRMMQDPKLSFNERLRAAGVLAYHMNTLNKMITQDGETDPFEEQNLGDFVRSVDPRIYTRLRREYRIWKKILTYRRR